MTKLYFLLFLGFIFMQSCESNKGKISASKQIYFENPDSSFNYFIATHHLKHSKKDKQMFERDLIAKNKKIKCIYTNCYFVHFGKEIKEKIGYSYVELFNKEGQIQRKYLSLHLKDTTIRKANQKKMRCKSKISYSNMLTTNSKNTDLSIVPYQKHIRTAYFYDKYKRIEFIIEEVKPSIPLKDKRHYANDMVMFQYVFQDQNFANLIYKQLKAPFEKFACPVRYDSVKNRILDDIGIELYPEPFKSNYTLTRTSNTTGLYYKQYITYFN